MCPSTLHVLGCLPIYLPALGCPCQVQERSRQLERQQSLRVDIEDTLTPRKATIESRLRQTAALTLTLIITLALTLTLTLTAVWLLVPLAPGSCGFWLRPALERSHSVTHNSRSQHPAAYLFR